MADRTDARKYGGGEDFGEYEQPLSEIKEEINTKAEEIAEIVNERNDRNGRLVAVGEEVRYQAINRRASTEIVLEYDRDRDISPVTKRARRLHAQIHSVMGNEIEELERDEQHRIEMMET